MNEHPVLEPSLPTEVELIHPTALLWGYEMQRTNKELTTRLIATKAKVEENEALTRTISKCLNDLIVIVASITTELNNTGHGSHHRLRVLRRQLSHALSPLQDYAQAIDEKNKTLINCIAELEEMFLAQPKSSEARDAPDSKIHATTSAENQELETPQKAETAAGIRETTPRRLESQPMEAKLAAVMKQDKRPLEDYYESAKDFRRVQRRLRQDNEVLFIHAFIAGLDKTIYRRRIVHWLKKEHWDWAWLEHIIMVLILEEQYFEKQEYALTHRFEDGSVMLPDGTREPQFVILSPITEEDLTVSEGE